VRLLFGGKARGPSSVFPGWPIGVTLHSLVRLAYRFDCGRTLRLVTYVGRLPGRAREGAVTPPPRFFRLCGCSRLPRTPGLRTDKLRPFRTELEANVSAAYSCDPLCSSLGSDRREPGASFPAELMSLKRLTSALGPGGPTSSTMIHARKDRWQIAGAASLADVRFNHGRKEATA
jgi:hypothetical protein